MDTEQIAAWTKLFATINESKWWVIAAVLVTAAGGACSFFYYLHVKRRERADIDKAKERRARTYGATLEELRVSIEHQRMSVESLHQQQIAVLSNLGAVVSKLVNSVRTLSAKFEGKLNRTDSIRLIHHIFEQDLFRDICSVVERSLRENDYLNRRVFIRDKIRTSISDSLGGARNLLASYPLSVNAMVYFQLAPDNTGERFMLVDEVWSAIEPKFDHGAGQLEHRTEEAYLAIENCLHDYVVRICSASADALNPAPGVPKEQAVSTYATPKPSKSDSDSALAALSAIPFETKGRATAALLQRQRVR